MERVGFVGLGTMGAAMAANLRRTGFEVTVWNRTPGRATDLLAQGAVEAATPADVARAVDVVVTCVSDTPDVDAVLFGEDGVASGLADGGLVIDCSTISPSATKAFAARLAGQGVRFCLNTDDPGISGIDIRHEYEVAAPAVGLSAEQIRQAQIDAVEMAFLEPAEKQALHNRGPS